jgi:hypothetical protein
LTFLYNMLGYLYITLNKWKHINKI